MVKFFVRFFLLAGPIDERQVMAMEFEEIYRRHFGDVYRYILRLSGNEHIAEEITSDTFFKAMGSIGKFRGECDLRTWLCQIAKNSYYTYIKKHSRTHSLDDEAAAVDPNAFLEEQYATKEAIRQGQDALHSLPDPYKEVFMWRVYAQLGFREIGQMYQKSENWACVTYHRARKMLKSRLEEDSYEK